MITSPFFARLRRSHPDLPDLEPLTEPVLVNTLWVFWNDLTLLPDTLSFRIRMGELLVGGGYDDALLNVVEQVGRLLFEEERKLPEPTLAPTDPLRIRIEDVVAEIEKNN